jgi:hypothetical protein
MSRSNGPGVPPNGWPVETRPVEGADPYHDPYYAQPSQRQPAPQQVPVQQHNHHTGQDPSLHQPYNPQTAGRQPRIQGGAVPPPARAPQAGLPNGGLPPYAPPPQGGYAPGQHMPQPSPAPYIPQGQVNAQGYQGYPQSHPQAYTPPPQAPAFAQAGPRPTQQPPQQRAAPAHNPGFEPTGRPTQQQPPYQPNYAPGPAAYVPETTARPTQPRPQQRAPGTFEGYAPPPSAGVDAHGYDLGNYMPSGMTPDPRTQRPAAQPAWQPHAEPQDRQPPLTSGYPGQYQAEEQHDPQAHQGGQEEEAYEDHHDDDEYDEEPRKTRYGLIAASLLFAIAAGGGLAYGYKMFAGNQTQASATPIVKSSTGPVKVKPVDPGGTKFANTDSKMMEQLSGSSAETPTDGGPKAVKTIVIPRDGSPNVPPPQDNLSAVQASTPSPQGVPGMILAGVPPLARAPQQAPVAAAVPVTIQPPAAPARPSRTVTAALQPPAATSDYDSTTAVPAAPPLKKPVVKKVAPPSGIGGPVAAPTGANGFVAVLASVPASASSRMDAMQQYADLQQRFTGVLGSKSPDVVEAKLEKGTFHRLVVGPPGSRDAAGSVCAQLKAAGYTADCWVTAF